MFSKYNLIILISIVFITCSPSKEEKEARAKFIADSTKAAQDSIKSYNEKLRMHEEMIEAGEMKAEIKLKDFLKSAENELGKADERLTKIKEFQFGRTQREKDDQITNQLVVRSQLSRIVEGLKSELAQNKIHKTFEFQDNPESVLEYLFESVKNNSTADMRHIIDPYGEYNIDIFMLGLMDIYPEDEMKKIYDLFSEGRIMGETKIDGDLATYEIAVGAGSSTLQKITLIKRMDKWYLKNF